MEASVRLVHRMIVQEELHILADHIHMEQLFVDDLETGHLAVLIRIVNGEFELSRNAHLQSPWRGGQIHVILDLIRDARNHLHAAAFANSGLIGADIRVHGTAINGVLRSQ